MVFDKLTKCDLTPPLVISPFAIFNNEVPPSRYCHRYLCYLRYLLLKIAYHFCLHICILGFAHLSCQVCGEGSGVCTDVSDNGKAQECMGESDVCLYSEVRKLVKDSSTVLTRKFKYFI